MRRRVLGQSAVWLSAVVMLALVSPRLAEAQVGLGPRLSFVRGDFTEATPDASFVGGTLRTQTSAHTGFEISLDYRSQLSDDRTQRLRETPLQMSLLIYPTRHRFSPYLLGGYGIYTDTTDALSATGTVLVSTSTHKSGWHIGFGGEFYLSRHVSVYGDYRFRFVQIGNDGTSTEPLHVPGLTLNHEGSMWTTGLSFYF